MPKSTFRHNEMTLTVAARRLRGCESTSVGGTNQVANYDVSRARVSASRVIFVGPTSSQHFRFPAASAYALELVPKQHPLSKHVFQGQSQFQFQFQS